MELRQLRYFLAVAQELHFGRAAEKVHIAQSPLSRQIRQLESSLGVELFRRNKHRVELTDAGRAFIPQARGILAATDQARHTALRAAAGMTGRITIGYSNSAIYTSFPKILVQYRRRYPQVEIALRDSLLTPMQIDALIDRRIDIGFLRPPVGHTSIETVVLTQQSLLLALPSTHEQARASEVDLADFSAEPFVMFSRALGSALVTTILRVCHDAGFHPHIEQEVGDVPTMIGLVAHGMGVALVPSAAQNMAIEGVVFKTLKNGGPQLEMAMAWSRELESPARDSFIGLVKEHIQTETVADEA